MRPRTGVVIVAAGSGTRLGAGVPKAFADLGGTSILERSLRPLTAVIGDLEVAIAAPPHEDWLERAAVIAHDVLYDVDGIKRIHVVTGGETRQQSVAAALEALSEQCDVVLVHDAARALASAELFERVAGAVRATGHGVIPALPVVDTIKRVAQAEGSSAGDARRVLETVNRDELRAVQTPQVSPAEQLRRAYAEASNEHTDDAALFAASGGEVTTVSGEHSAFKVTTPNDLARARGGGGASTGLNAQRDLRVGIGTDIHAFADDDSTELWLAGLHWPGERGLSGHSDGDAIAHAMCDALLSAAGLGDIGGMFGTDDPELEGAHGDVFLTRTRARLDAAGFDIVNVAVQVIALRPRFSPRREEAVRVLSDLVGAPVSVSATTSDGLGFVGRTEGVFAIATALVSGRQSA